MFPVGPAQSGSGRKEYQSQIAFLTRTLSKLLDTYRLRKEFALSV
jgi:hypothetical protein